MPRRGRPIRSRSASAWRLTGAVAPNGKQNLLALEIWRDDVNAKGGLLGRPVELVYYDDQSNPNNVPGIYTKLLSVDKVDLLLGPYATNMIAPAMPVIMQANKMTIGMLGVNINRQFNYPRYFSMVPGGDEGTLAFSRGWFEIAAAQAPKPQDGRAHRRPTPSSARRRAMARARTPRPGGFDIVYDKSYPPGTTDMVPIVRAIQATNPDLVFACGYPPDTVGIVRAANEIGLNAKMFGGAMIGLLATPIKMQLGPLVNGLVIMESFIPAPTLNFPGLKAMLDQVSGQSARARHRSAGLWIYAVRVCGRRGAGAGGRGEPKVSITASLQTTSTPTNSPPWRAKSPSGRMANGRSRDSFSPSSKA